MWCLVCGVWRPGGAEEMMEEAAFEGVIAAIDATSNIRKYCAHQHEYGACTSMNMVGVLEYVN